MKTLFRDPQFEFQMLRMLGGAASGSADVGECLSTADRIVEGDFESWHREWLATAERVEGIAERCLAGGHETSAREAFARASNYYRAAEFYLHGDPNDARIADLFARSVRCFDRALALQALAAERVEIPYEGASLPGIFYAAPGDGAARPTLLLQTGYDGTMEELHAKAVAANRRGWSCLTFEGPGQGRVIRERGLPFRHDWEHVVTPVVDYALSRGDVAAEQVALLGQSLGGYLAPRAVAFEQRIMACVANGGVFDFMGSRVPPVFSRAQFVEMVESSPDAFDEGMRAQMEQNSELRWAAANGMFTFRVETPSAWMKEALRFELSEVVGQIRCPVLVVDTEDEASFPGEAQKLYDALSCPKEFMLFTRAEGAGAHCQVASPALSQQRIFDWLADRFAEAAAG